MNRSMYHPVAIGADFIRKNIFDLLVTGSGNDFNSINLLCRTITITLPTSNSVQVPWIGGIMQVAGRLSNAFTFNAQFYVGHDMNYDALRSLYAWRNLVWNHDTGALQLASNYKRTGNITVYDLTGTIVQYQIECNGMWPTNIQDINMDVADDGVLEVSAQFAADKIWIRNLH